MPVRLNDQRRDERRRRRAKRYWRDRLLLVVMGTVLRVVGLALGTGVAALWARLTR